jgi:uncharacterized Zn-finger protein
MGGCFIINNNISQAECDRVCAFVRGVLSHGNSVSALTSDGHTDDGSARSIGYLSSTSSLETSHSNNGSFTSAFSYKSRGSIGSFGSFGNRGRRRRRRRQPPFSPTAMRPPVLTFQCTFCTETFKTKHDWERHEKSLHLSLERWVCTLEGPTRFSTEWGCPACVYCCRLQNRGSKDCVITD